MQHPGPTESSNLWFRGPLDQANGDFGDKQTAVLETAALPTELFSFVNDLFHISIKNVLSLPLLSRNKKSNYIVIFYLDLTFGNLLLFQRSSLVCFRKFKSVF